MKGLLQCDCNGPSISISVEALRRVAVIAFLKTRYDIERHLDEVRNSSEPTNTREMVALQSCAERLFYAARQHYEAAEVYAHLCLCDPGVAKKDELRELHITGNMPEPTNPADAQEDNR